MFTICDLRFIISSLVQISADGGSVTFAVRIVPRASRSEIVGEFEGALRVRIAAPPVEGAANRELITFLAKQFKLPQNAIEIIAGTNSKNKIIRLKNAERVLKQLRKF